ncbi:MAG TPA: GNAT family N-acetyltransferase [Anaerolineales bacterium]|nr:GNAT family N-acetyltransferase [Anaerolineales bacterium]
MNRDAPVISADRLDLITLSTDVLRLSLARDVPAVERRLGISVPADWFEEVGLIRFRLEQLAEDPTYLPWSVRAMSHRAERQMVGYINFHTKPGDPYLNAHAPDGVEFGFEVFPPYRRRGFAREACHAIMKWAYERHRIPEFVVSISPENVPSLQLARSLGFERVGSHMDERDGLEDVFKLTYRPRDAA